MSEVALNRSDLRAGESTSRAGVLKRLRTTDVVFHGLTRAAAIAVLVLLSGVIMSLIHGSIPALGAYGFGFFTTEVWNPVTEQFGALAPIYGTLVTSALAMLIAVPVAVGLALFLTEMAPARVRRIESTLQRTGVTARVLCADATRQAHRHPGEVAVVLLLNARGPAGMSRRHRCMSPNCHPSFLH